MCHVLKVAWCHAVCVSTVLQVAREIQIHAGLDHPHIIGLYGAFEDTKHVYLVQEFAPGASSPPSPLAGRILLCLPVDRIYIHLCAHCAICKSAHTQWCQDVTAKLGSPVCDMEHGVTKVHIIIIRSRSSDGYDSCFRRNVSKSAVEWEQDLICRNTKVQLQILNYRS